RRNRAVKSCLVCLAYYCETHVKPHYESATFKRHKLVDETGHLDLKEHRGHNTVSAEDERVDKQKMLVVTQSEVQHVIQERMKELQDLRHNVDVLKGNAHRAQEASDKIFSEMLQSVERWHAEICQLIQANLHAAMAQASHPTADSYVERLEQEIMEMQRQDAELRHILDTEDNIHFLQNFPVLCIAPEPMVPKVLINQEFSFGEVTKTVTDMKENLDDICKKEMDNLSKKGLDSVSSTPTKADLQEPKTRADFLRYTVRLTFDPNTAYKELVLSDGNRRVVRKRMVQFYPEHPERFDGFCQILCAEPLSGFRHYWEVEWSGEFSVGVTYKSISRKGKNSHSLLGYNDRSWSLLCSNSGYSAWHNRTDKDIPRVAMASRIGVYLDYAGNSVSFYAVSENMQLIYRFLAKFSEPLYAGYGVGASVSLCSPEKITQLVSETLKRLLDQS
ncbi:hypothetical protein QTP86_023033, partial [Hemibagrus guttatus]